MFINSIIPIFSTKGIWKYANFFHFIEFIILGLLYMNSFFETSLNFKKIKIALIFFTLIPIVDEGLQYFFIIPGRVADVNDIIIDLVGGYCGVILCIFIYKLKELNG